MKSLILKAYKYVEKNRSQVITLLILFVTSLILAVITEYISRGSFGSTIEFLYYYSFQFMLTTTVIFITGLFLVYITNLLEVGIIFNSVVFPFFATVNYFKLDFRKEPIFPWDFFVVGDAMDILPEVSLIPTVAMIIGIIVIAIIITGVFLLRFKYKVKTGFKSFKNRGISLLFLLSFTIIFGYFSFFNETFMSYNGISINQWDQAKGYSRGGLIPSFIMNFKYIKVQKPDEYSEKKVLEIADSVEKSDTATETKPNVIVIMSEAFTDLTRASKLTFNEPLMPTIDYLRENYISGYVLAAQYGGGTANSEFEVLTGYSMANLPTGCTPYQQFILKNTNAIPSFMTSQGYNTVAIHTFGRRFWNRNSVYKKFGFDYFVASDNFVLPDRERGFISDHELTNKIITEYENNLSSGKPFFNFSVSVQNHTSYRANEYALDEQLSITDASGTVDPELLAKVTTLATGEHSSDAALGELINYFSNVKTPTVIVFYGDHLAKFTQNYDAYSQIGYFDGNTDNAENMFKLYSTPFVVWNNFSQKKISNVNISMYQLLPYVYNEFNIVRPTYYNYLTEQASVYKGFAKGIFLDSNGTPTFDASDAMNEYLEKHQMLQYDLFSGKGYASDLLWN